VSLNVRDWSLLEGLAAEIEHRQNSRATVSEAVRHVLRHYFDSQPWRIAYARGADAPTFAEFQTGTTSDGQVVLRRVNVETGETQTAVRPGPFFPDEKPKPRRR
jgi:hypothetical protein